MYFRKRGDRGEIIIVPLYQRGDVMNSRKAEGRTIVLVMKLIPYFFILTFLVATNGAGLAASEDFRVVYPTDLYAGNPLKIHVVFPSDPPSHVFYQLEVTVDGQPVAMADLSEERSTWITAPPQKSGRHRFSVIWRNPPGGMPIENGKDLFILPKKQ